MNELSRNESADKLRNIWANIIEHAPGSTRDIRKNGPAGWLGDVAGIHSDHLAWLINALNSEKVLNAIDRLAKAARDAGGEVKGPWRD